MGVFFFVSQSVGRLLYKFFHLIFFLVFLKTLIAAALGAGLSQTFTVDRDVHMLLIKRTSDTSVLGHLKTGCPEVVAANITDHSGGYIDLFSARTPLGAAVAFTQYNRGPVVELFSSGVAVIGADSAVIPKGKYVVYLPVVITPAMCIGVADGERMEFRIDGMLEGATYEIHTLSGPVTDRVYYNFSRRVITAEQPRLSYDVDSLAALVVPATAAIQSVRVTYANGKTEQMNLTSLKFINSENNPVETKQVRYDGDQRSNLEGLSLQSEYLVLPVGDVTHIEIETDGSASIEFVQVQARHKDVVYR